MILYNIITAYQPYEKHMDFRISYFQYVHRPQSIVYKVDQFVLGTLLSSLTLLNIKVIFYFHLRT